jgi:outer membrane protein TolC
LYPYQKAIQVAFQEVSDALIALQKSREQLVVIGRQVDALRTYFARIRALHGCVTKAVTRAISKCPTPGA